MRGALWVCGGCVEKYVTQANYRHAVETEGLIEVVRRARKCRKKKEFFQRYVMIVNVKSQY